MTTINIDYELLEEVVEKWKRENPIDTDLSTTKIVRRVFYYYVNDGSSHNTKNK